MKKLLLVTAALASLSATAASAQVNLDVNFGAPSYVEAQPVVVEHPYLPGHYNGRDRHHEGRDWRYAHDVRHDDHHPEYDHRDDHGRR